MQVIALSVGTRNVGGGRTYQRESVRHEQPFLMGLGSDEFAGINKIRMWKAVGLENMSRRHEDSGRFRELRG
jgi:hypothetical protein